MKSINRLTALQVKRAVGPTTLQDGGGLSLKVRKTGSRSWVFKYRWRNSRPEIGLGSWPTVSLADARTKAEQARKWLSSTPKQNPRLEWAKLAAAEEAARKQISFGAYALSYIELRAKGWKNQDHKRQWIGSLSRHASQIWEKPIQDVNTSDIVGCLKPIWYEIPTTAKRVLGRIELVFDAAKAEGYVSEGNPAVWRGNLQSVLPKVRKQEVHHPAIELEDVPVLWRWLSKQDAMSARCLQFLILTATRSGEARGTKWSEIDFENALWTIAESRTKNGDQLRIPLSSTAIAILRAVRELPGNIVFPSPMTSEPMSDRALQKLCRKSEFTNAEGKSITPHGFRAAFRTWAEYNTDEDTAERALGHRRPKLIRSYARGDLLERRRIVMESWGAHVLSGTTD